MTIYIICSSRSDAGPLESVIAALPEASVVGFTVDPNAPPAREMGVAIQWFSEKLKGASLAIMVGDRFETLAAALACTFLRVPIAHIHGGETTTGAFDDAMRHSITHLTHQSAGIHFAATGRAQMRIHRTITSGDGECPDSLIPLVGAPGLDGVPQNSAKRDKNLIVASYYAETMADDYGLAGCHAMLNALRPYTKDHAIFFSTVNTDPGSVAIGMAIQDFIAAHPTSATWISPNTREQYMHLMQHAKLLIGNSSSGVIEAPWVGLPSVNIGRRQDGREMANSVFSPLENVDSLGEVINYALAWRRVPAPIYRGGAAPRIAEVVREFVSACKNTP